MKKINKYNIDDFLIKSEGQWNNPYIDSEIIGLFKNGYEPKYSGGCFGILPFDDMFVLLGEDDDHYFDICKISLDELLILKNIFKKLSDSVSVKIDYIKGMSTTEYRPNKEIFTNTDFSESNFKVSVTDRGETISPLVCIENNIFIYNLQFDISWSGRKFMVINDFLKSIK